MYRRLRRLASAFDADPRLKFLITSPPSSVYSRTDNRWLKRGAAAGDASAAYSLYLAGVDGDKHLAIAAASGHAGACVDLAKTASSSREALKLLRRAVHNGGAAAAYCALGRLFLGAPGLVPDPTAAAGFFARSGNAEAQACLAALYGRVPRPLADSTPAPAREGGMLLLW